jgi:hypothetical protein
LINALNPNSGVGNLAKPPSPFNALGCPANIKFPGLLLSLARVFPKFEPVPLISTFIVFM